MKNIHIYSACSITAAGFGTAMIVTGHSAASALGWIASGLWFMLVFAIEVGG